MLFLSLFSFLTVVQNLIGIDGGQKFSLQIAKNHSTAWSFLLPRAQLLFFSEQKNGSAYSAASANGRIVLTKEAPSVSNQSFLEGYSFAFDAAASSHDTKASAVASSADTSHALAESSDGSAHSGYGTVGSEDGAENAKDDQSGQDGLHFPEILYIFLTLIIGAIARYGLKMVRHRFVMPYTVFVLLLGCIYGLLEFQFEGNFSKYVQIATADPNVILLIFLPGLIYEAAFSMQTHLFQKLLLHMLIIGSLGLAFNVALIGFISQEMFKLSSPGWNIKIGMLFSAIVSATDPIAAVALLKEAGSAKTLTTVLEGTSLLSDTSAVVLFNFFLQLADTKASDPSQDSYIISLFKNVLGGPAWGLGIGFLLTTLLSRMSSVWKAELILILSMPYLVFWTSDAGFQISGALATMVLGLWMSSHRTSISPDVEELVDRIWELVSLISNTLIFSLVGVIIVRTTLRTQTGGNRLVGSDWLDLIIINIFLILVRAFGFILLKPVLNRLGIGGKVFTWPHVFVLSWGGFKGAVTLALGMMAAEKDFIKGMPDVRTKLLFHSAGVVAFTLLFNASTMRFFLKRLGILDMPMSEMITMHMALKQILMVRDQKLNALKSDRYLADADWQKVEDLTKIEGFRYGIEDESQTSLWTIHYVTREVTCPSCEAEVQLEPLPSELAEMESVARLRLVNAKKTSYWRQYEEGTLSQSGVKYLDDLSDTVLNSDHGVIGADDINHSLHDELWTKFKEKMGKFQYWIEYRKSTVWYPPEKEWRRPFFIASTSLIFKYFIYLIILGNLVESITDWVLVGLSEAAGYHIIFLYTNFTFAIIYTAEAAIKILGVGWKAYWGKSWFNWNRFDFLLLSLTYIDLIMDFLTEYDDDVLVSGVMSTSIIRVFRFFKLIRFGRALRLFKPLVPRILLFLDGRINAHLFVAYDIAKAFMVAQEECSMMVPTVIGYKPLAAKLKSQADGDCRIVLKEIGLLNEKRPDVAAAVKTRQAIRSILNHLYKSVQHMRSQGILDAQEVDHLQTTIEARLKKLHHFPHSIGIVRSLDRLWNVPWINGSQEVLEVMKLLFEERQHETASQFLTADNEPDGIYLLVSGVVSLTYHRRYLDNPDLGQIYNCDNLRATVEEGSAEDESPRLDYILPGGLINEQSLALGFPRRSDATSDTAISLLYLKAEYFFGALAVLPALEAQFWRRIASSVARNILIKSGSLTDSSFEVDKLRLSRAAVRLVRPGLIITGLDDFEDVFLITGTLTDITTTDHEAIIGPRKVPANYHQVEVRQGRPAVTNQHGQVIYPEYAILFLVPPGNRDLSMVNLHDSQTNLLERPPADPHVLREFVKISMADKTGKMPTDAELPPSFHDDQTVASLAAASHHSSQQREYHHDQLMYHHTTNQVEHVTGRGNERRGSDVGAILQFAKTRQSNTSQIMFNVLAHHHTSQLTASHPEEATAHDTPVSLEGLGSL